MTQLDPFHARIVLTHCQLYAFWHRFLADVRNRALGIKTTKNTNREKFLTKTIQIF